MMQNPSAEHYKQLNWKPRDKIFLYFWIVETDIKDFKLSKHFFFIELIPCQTNAIKIGCFEMKIKIANKHWLE